MIAVVAAHGNVIVARRANGIGRLIAVMAFAKACQNTLLFLGAETFAVFM